MGDKLDYDLLAWRNRVTSAYSYARLASASTSSSEYMQLFITESLACDHNRYKGTDDVLCYVEDHSSAGASFRTLMRETI
jgi:hypothetical protein